SKADKLKYERIVEYLGNRTLCRTTFLTVYVGEVNYNDCEVCDVCLEKRKESKGAHVDRTLYEFIKAKLQGGPASLEGLLKNQTMAEKQELTTMIRLMLDNRILRYDDDGKLFLVNPN